MSQTSRRSRTHDRGRIVVRRADPLAPELLLLVQHLWDELAQLYPEAKAPPSAPPIVAGERSGFVVAWLEGAAVGCGAFRPLAPNEPAVVEIKRMFVEPSARRRGVSRAILWELERLARASDFSVVRLETGMRQPGAIRLYETSGYQRIERFGRYRDDPLSVCFEKALTSPRLFS